MRDNLYIILAFISIIASVAAFVIFWVGKVLNLRDVIKELQMNATFDRQRAELDRQERIKLEKRLEELEDKLYRVT